LIPQSEIHSSSKAFCSRYDLCFTFLSDACIKENCELSYLVIHPSALESLIHDFRFSVMELVGFGFESNELLCSMDWILSFFPFGVTLTKPSSLYAKSSRWSWSGNGRKYCPWAPIIASPSFVLDFPSQRYLSIIFTYHSWWFSSRSLNMLHLFVSYIDRYWKFETWEIRILSYHSFIIMQIY
jgi:hypothetical protein